MVIMSIFYWACFVLLFLFGVLLLWRFFQKDEYPDIEETLSNLLSEIKSLREDLKNKGGGNDKPKQ